MLKRALSMVLIALVAWAWLPAGGAAQAPAPIKIGVIQPLSGAVAASGNYVRMGAEIRVEGHHAVVRGLHLEATHRDGHTTMLGSGG